MLGDVQDDVLLESEFADEYQEWLEGRAGPKSAPWFDFPVRKLATNAPLCAGASDSVAEVVGRMRELKSGTALIVSEGDPRGRRGVLGIFTERDLLRRVVADGRSIWETRVSEVMTEAPEVLPVDASLAQALRHLARARYRHIPLVDDAGTPVAMLSSRHVIRFVSDTFPKEVLNAPPESAHDPMRAEGA